MLIIMSLENHVQDRNLNAPTLSFSEIVVRHAQLYGGGYEREFISKMTR